jgi:hypothetical protein
VFDIEFTDQAIEDLQLFKKHEQNVIIDGIEASLSYEPTIETRNRKVMNRAIASSAPLQNSVL